jgi:lipopolysaccharide transport system ATP-binding protein
MYVRLAFAVAAHLEPEILLVDEVLAVGDAEFQKKCLGKMQDVSKGGRTVLFVSHNMAVIQALCPKTILLESGRVRMIGSSADAALAYLASGSVSTLLERPARPNGIPTITRLELTEVNCREETLLRFNLQVQGEPRKRCSIEVKISDAMGMPLGFASVGLLDPEKAVDLLGGIEEWSCTIKLPRMARGKFRLSVALAFPMIDFIDTTGDGLLFEIAPAPLPGYARVLDHSWGYGAFELPFEMTQKHPTAEEEQRFEIESAVQLARG